MGGSQRLSPGFHRLGDFLAAVGVVLYFALGFVQLLAIIAGVQNWLGVHWLLSGFVAFFLAYIPIVGTVLGILGAMSAWGLSLWSALAIFLLPYLIGLVIGLSVTAVEEWRWRHPTPSPKTDDFTDFDFGGIEFYEPPADPENPSTTPTK
jgi:hypothetical protein